MQRLGLFSLASGAGTHVVANEGVILWNVEVLAQLLERFMDALVTDTMGQQEHRRE
jgi:hypothetical protein